MAPWEESWDASAPFIWRADPGDGSRLHNIVRVCVGENPDSEGDPEQQARLQLASAAPDLCRALEAVVEAIAKGPAFYFASDVRAQAAAALVKAKER